MRVCFDYPSHRVSEQDNLRRGNLQMTRTRPMWQALVMALVLVTGCFYAKHAAAQNGMCVLSYTTVEINCQGYQCRYSLVLNVPSGGYGAGVFYYPGTVNCCGNPVSTLGPPDGMCRAGGTAPQAQPAESNLVFVRGCDGRFRLYAVAKRKDRSGKES